MAAKRGARLSGHRLDMLVMHLAEWRADNSRRPVGYQRVVMQEQAGTAGWVSAGPFAASGKGHGFLARAAHGTQWGSEHAVQLSEHGMQENGTSGAREVASLSRLNKELDLVNQCSKVVRWLHL